jgi:hypothetical protein
MGEKSIQFSASRVVDSFSDSRNWKLDSVVACKTFAFFRGNGKSRVNSRVNPMGVGQTPVA